MMPLNTSCQNSKLTLYLRSALFQFCLIISTLFFCPIMLAAIIFPVSIRFKIAKLWVRFNLWAVYFFCGLSYQVEGLENIPKQGNAIILSKHQSAWETLALQLFFPDVVFLLKRELLWLPFWGWAMATLKPIAIDRSSQREALRNLLEQGAARLKEGLWIIIFPEGTRVAPGKKRKFNAGGVLLAQRTGYPIVPVAHNAGEFWPRYSFLKYPGVIKVKIGPPIDVAGKKAGVLNDEVYSWISHAMSEISVFER